MNRKDAKTAKAVLFIMRLLSLRPSRLGDEVFFFRVVHEG